MSFPMIIKLTKCGSTMIIQTASELPSGTPFKVLMTGVTTEEFKDGAVIVSKEK